MIQLPESRNHRHHGRVAAAFFLYLLALTLAPLAIARKSVDFDTSLDFSKLKAIAYLIDPKQKDAAWGLYLEQKIAGDDSIWPKALAEISKRFTSFPPSKKEIEEKKKERAEHPPKPAAQ